MVAVVLGAGIGGLAAAWQLQKKGYDVVVLEASNRCGGWIRSENEGGFFFETGPRSLRPAAATLALIDELGLSSKIRLPQSHERYLYTEGALRKVPSSFVQFLKAPWVWPALSMAIPRKVPEEDLSIHTFFKMRYGAFCADVAADALTAGIFAGNPERLSMQACFPQFGKKREKTKLKTALYTLDGGLETLVQALHERLDVRLLSPVHNIREGILEEADLIVSALPAHALKKILDEPLLDYFESASLAVVTLGWKKNLLPVEGFGYLIPKKEGEKILGCVFDSSVFPSQNQSVEETRLTVMIGGDRSPELLEHSFDELGKCALEALSRHLGINEAPDFCRVHMAKSAIPQYRVGHRNLVSMLERRLAETHPKLRLAGSSFYGVAVNDSIAHNISNLESFALKR